MGMSTDLLITPAELRARLGDGDLVVLDATYYLAHEGRNARAEFEAAHIPGARFFDIDLFADPETDLPHMVPSAFRFARLAGELGISNASSIVVYDQKGMFSAPRAWWLFGLFGHDAVRVLAGGLPAWREANLPIETGPATPRAAAEFTPDLRATWLRGLGDLRANLESRAELVLDARPAGRFEASAPEPRPNLPAGHMPGAVNLPATALLEGGTYLAPGALRARFAQAGVTGDRPVVTSCGSGITAAILTLGLRLAGLPQGALYDGSWTEWASRPDTPKEAGPATTP